MCTQSTDAGTGIHSSVLVQDLVQLSGHRHLAKILTLEHGCVDIGGPRQRVPSGHRVSPPVEGMCCKPKYRANIIHHFIFVFFRYLFYHSSCRKDQIIVLSLKFGFQDFTDPGLLRKILRSLTGLSLWFCLHECFSVTKIVV